MIDTVLTYHTSRAPGFNLHPKNKNLTSSYYCDWLSRWLVHMAI